MMHGKGSRFRLRGHYRSLFKARPCSGIESAIMLPFEKKRKRTERGKDHNGSDYIKSVSPFGLIKI